MKRSRLLSAVTAMVMSICMMSGTFSTASACSNCNPPSDEVHGMGDLPIYYTLEELFAMSDEEFFELYGAESRYDEVRRDAEGVWEHFDKVTYSGISGELMISLPDEKADYTANETEMAIEKLLGDTVKYEIVSPISLDWNYLEENWVYYGNILWVRFPDYNLYAETNDITDKEIIEFAKCWYCVNQVINIYYSHIGSVLAAAPGDEQVLSGDVNFDKTVNLYDSIWLAKGLIKKYKLTDAQLYIADVNKDGSANVFDLIILSRRLINNINTPTT